MLFRSQEEIEYALEQRVLSFNVESEAELAYIDRIARGKNVRAPIALRINPDVDAGTHRYVSTGRSENKFGIALDRVAEIYERAAAMPNIAIRGVQMHIGSQITDATPFAEAIEKVTPLIQELKERYALEFFSVGGGVGIVYESSMASGSGDWWSEKDRVRATTHLPLTIHDYVAAISPPLRAIGVRFDRVANEVIDIAERRIEPAVMIENRARAVDIERRPIFLRDAFESHAFAMEIAVLVAK